MRVGELPDELPPVSIEMTVFLFSNTPTALTRTPSSSQLIRNNSSSQLVVLPQTPTTPYAAFKSDKQSNNTTTGTSKRSFLRKIVGTGKTPKKIEG